MATLTRPDLTTNYQLVGTDAPPGRLPVALIHGLGANLAFWVLGAAPILAQDRPLLMHDLRGHGASSMPARGYRLEELADDFGALLDSVGFDRAHVVGHSHGARVALAFAMANPARVATLTLADTQLRALQPPMRLREWSHWPRWKADLAAQGRTSFPDDESEIDFRVLADLGPRGSNAARRALPAVQADSVPTDAAAAAWGSRLQRDGRPGAVRLITRGAPERRIDLRSRQMGARGGRQWQALLDTTTAGTDLDDESALTLPALARVAMPTLLIYGEASHCVPTSDRLLDRLPDARRVLVPGAGHFFPLVKPRAFARALRIFLAGAEARAGTRAEGPAQGLAAAAPQALRGRFALRRFAGQGMRRRGEGA